MVDKGAVEARGSVHRNMWPRVQTIVGSNLDHQKDNRKSGGNN
jgi:hypothetical protein